MKNLLLSLTLTLLFLSPSYSQLKGTYRVKSLTFSMDNQDYGVNRFEYDAQNRLSKIEMYSIYMGGTLTENPDIVIKFKYADMVVTQEFYRKDSLLRKNKYFLTPSGAASKVISYTPDNKVTEVRKMEYDFKGFLMREEIVKGEVTQLYSHDGNRQTSTTKNAVTKFVYYPDYMDMADLSTNMFLYGNMETRREGPFYGTSNHNLLRFIKHPDGTVNEYSYTMSGKSLNITCTTTKGEEKSTYKIAVEYY